MQTATPVTRSTRQPFTKRLLNGLAAMGVIALLLQSMGCSTIERDWERTKQVDTVQAYNTFLLEHQNTSLSASARSRIESLTMDAARKVNDRGAYENYLNAYPNGQFASEARRKLDDMAFVTAKKSNSVQAMEDYLKEFRNGAHAAEVRSTLESLSYEGAEKTNTIIAFQEYVARFPNGQQVKEARLAIKYLPLLTACMDGDDTTVNALMEAGHSLTNYAPATRRLMELLLAQVNASPVTSGDRMAAQTLPESTKSAQLKSFQLLLRAGASQTEMKIWGSENAIVPTYGTPRRLSAMQGGLYAMEFAQKNALSEFEKALRHPEGLHPLDLSTSQFPIVVTKVDFPARVTVSTGMFAITDRGDAEERKTFSPKAGHRLLRVLFELEVEKRKPPFTLARRQLEMRTPDGKVLAPLDFYIPLSADLTHSIHGELSLGGKESFGVTFVVPSDDDKSEFYVANRRVGSIKEIMASTPKANSAR